MAERRTIFWAGRVEEPMARIDLAISQTVCISHNTCRRVKNHCNRTGKPCVFVGTTSTAGVKRAVAELQISTTSV